MFERPKREALIGREGHWGSRWPLTATFATSYFCYCYYNFYHLLLLNYYFYHLCLCTSHLLYIYLPP